jgi:hypothetical protein
MSSAVAFAWHAEDVVITALRCGHQGLSVDNNSVRVGEECNPFRSLRGLLDALQANSPFFSFACRCPYDRDKRARGTVKWVGRGAEPNDGDW